MGDLAKNFSRAEFACKCGCMGDTVDFQLLQLLQQLRDDLRVRVRIVSGYRCADHNRKVQGSPNSQHLRGKAADIQVDGFNPGQIFDYICAHVPENKFGVGLYSTFVHVDVRDRRARWIE